MDEKKKDSDKANIEKDHVQKNISDSSDNEKENNIQGNTDNNLEEGYILKKSSSKNIIIFAAAFTSFLAAFLTSSITVALPVIAKEFMIDVILQNWLATSFLLAIAIFSVPFGKLSGKFGLKKFFSLGVIILIISTVGASLAFSAYSLIFFRVIQGIAVSMVNVAGFAMITEALPPHERGKGIGITISSVYIGLTLAPVLGGILTKNLGWQSIFYVVIPLLFIPLILTILKIREEWVTGRDHPFDFIGTIIYSIGILLFMYGFTILNQLAGVILTVLGLFLLIGFTFFELRQKFPVFHMDLFKNIKFASSNLAALISYLATFVVTYILSYYFQYIKQLDPQTTGLILIVTPALMAIVAPFSGKLSDKFEPQKLSALGMGFVAIALFILIFLNEKTSLEVILISMVLQGIGYGIFSSPNTNSIMGSVPRKFAPLASATVSTVRVIGQTMSLGMLTVIFAIMIGSVQIIPKYYSSLIQSSQIAFIISTILCVIAILASLAGVKSKIKINS
ncbi:MAG: MFS transporter [Methanobacteriaceae archaeon]|jgi:EmrB/QacA subfamily drug resistance transporter|nr:MFS transporter [Candidatus Methanorudis spinitermitis]